MDRIFSRLFKAAAWAPLAAAVLLLALQTVFALDSRALWFSDEIRYANVFEHVTEAGKWLVMYLNGTPYPDKPPVYFWFLSGLLPIFKGPTPALFMAGAALSGLFFLTATMALSRFVARAGREVSLAAGLVLVSCFYFIGLTHYSRMDLLFASLITASHICLFLAWQKDKATGLTIAGFLLAGVASLTKGPLAVVFPVLASLAYLAWTGNIRRFFRRDVAIGFAACLGLLGAWIAAAWFGGERELVNNIFYKQIYRRAVNASHHEQPFWHYFATLPAAWLPWTFLLFALPLKRLFSGDFWRGLWADRKNEANHGTVYLWIMVLSGFILLSSLSTKIIVYLMPIFPALAILTAKGVLGLSEEASKRLWLWVGGLFALVAVTLPFGNFLHQWGDYEIGGLLITALASAAAAFIVWRFVRTMAPASGLMLFALLVTLWTQPLMLKVMPSLDGTMSPKAQGTLMGEYIAKGYEPMAYKIYSGVYTYYCGRNILETQDLPLIESMVQERPKVVIGMQKKYWERWENRPETLRVVHEQYVVDRPYVLLVKDGPVELEAPAAAPATETKAPVAEPDAPANQ